MSDESEQVDHDEAATDSSGSTAQTEADATGTSAGQTSAGQTSAGQTSAGQTSADTGKFCTNCGSSISREAEICPECGVRQDESASASSSTGEKEPGISAVLSFLIPGVGQFYNGQVGRGAVVFISWAVWEFVALVITTLTIGIFFLIWIPVELVVHIVAAYDGYNQAEKINAGDVVVD